MSGRLLLLSNGHGEDAIGARLAGPLRGHGLALEAMPIVGVGHAYQALDVPIVGPTAPMPSGGFVYGRPAALAGDLAHGLAGLTWRQLQAIRAGRGRWDLVLAIGDVVPLAFAWLARTPYAFVGCAKSDLYLGGRPGAYIPPERWLLRHPRCRGVWPRDPVTTANLQAMGIAAAFLGNPMMDGLEPTGRPLPGDPGAPTVVLLPGSRGEAIANMAVLRRAALALQASGRPLRLLAALAPGFEPAAFAAPGWPYADGALRHADGATIWLLEGALADAAHAADLALAMAGTATEQVVGLGVPAIAIPGAGPQFTPAFAEAQARLLGESLAVMPDDPARVAAAAWALLDDPVARARLGEAGRARLGPPGGAARIAAAVRAAACAPTPAAP